MRLLTLDNQNVDLIMVQQKQLGNYSNLHIDMCGIIDRSVSKKKFIDIREDKIIVALLLPLT